MNFERVQTPEGPVERLAGFEQYLREHGQEFFSARHPLWAARAPARLDCMGGIADYSGSLVFEATLGRAAVVGVQRGEDDLLRARRLERANKKD